MMDAMKFLVMMATVISINVAGLRHGTRCASIINSLKDFKFDFAFLQETHLDRNTIHILKSVWRGQIFHSDGKFNSAGVAILCRKRIKNPIIDRDDCGRYLSVSFSDDEGQKLRLINICSPSGDNRQREREQFFLDLQNRAPQAENDELLLLGGDFNMALS